VSGIRPGCPPALTAEHLAKHCQNSRDQELSMRSTDTIIGDGGTVFGKDVIAPYYIPIDVTGDIF